LRNAQDSLGRICDVRVACGLLAPIQAGAGPMTAFVLGWLAARQADATPDETVQHVQALMKLKFAGSA
jgi:hypothetical protein